MEPFLQGLNCMQKIWIGSDHAAFETKEILKNALASNYKLVDVGTDSTESCHYPEYAIAVAREVQKEAGSLGILLCGSGIGVSIVANKFKGVRAALCHEADQGILTKQHNNANILCLAARMSSPEKCLEIVKAWLNSEFEGGRHQTRLDLFQDLGQE